MKSERQPKIARHTVYAASFSSTAPPTVPPSGRGIHFKPLRVLLFTATASTTPTPLPPTPLGAGIVFVFIILGAGTFPTRDFPNGATARGFGTAIRFTASSPLAIATAPPSSSLVGASLALTRLLMRRAPSPSSANAASDCRFIPRTTVVGDVTKNDTDVSSFILRARSIHIRSQRRGLGQAHHTRFCSPRKQLIRPASSRHRASPRAISRIRAYLFLPSFAASCAIARGLRVALCGVVGVDEIFWMSIGMRARAIRRHTTTPTRATPTRDSWTRANVMEDFASAPPAAVGSDGVVNAGDQDAERERQEANEARRASALASILEPAARERCTCVRVRWCARRCASRGARDSAPRANVRCAKLTDRRASSLTDFTSNAQ